MYIIASTLKIISISVSSTKLENSACSPTFVPPKVCMIRIVYHQRAWATSLNLPLERWQSYTAIHNWVSTPEVLCYICANPSSFNTSLETCARWRLLKNSGSYEFFGICALGVFTVDSFTKLLICFDALQITFYQLMLLLQKI